MLLGKGLQNFYTKFQVNILKHSVAITEKHDRQSSLLHPVHTESLPRTEHIARKNGNLWHFFKHFVAQKDALNCQAYS